MGAFRYIDLESYNSKERGMLVDLNDISITEVASSWSELFDVVKTLDDRDQSISNRVECLANRYHTYQDSLSSNRVIQVVKERYGC